MRLPLLAPAPALASMLGLAVAASAACSSPPPPTPLPEPCVTFIRNMKACTDHLTGHARETALMGVLMLEQGWHDPANRPADVAGTCTSMAKKLAEQAAYRAAGCTFTP